MMPNTTRQRWRRQHDDYGENSTSPHPCRDNQDQVHKCINAKHLCGTKCDSPGGALKFSRETRCAPFAARVPEKCRGNPVPGNGHCNTKFNHGWSELLLRARAGELMNNFLVRYEKDNGLRNSSRVRQYKPVSFYSYL